MMSAHIAIRATAPADLAALIEAHKRGCDRETEPTAALNRSGHWPE